MFRTRFTKTAVSMLAAALLGVLTVGGCSDDGEESGDGRSPANLGTTLTINEQVYIDDAYTPFDGSRAIVAIDRFSGDEIGGSGNITSGQLSFIIDRPEYLISGDNYFSNLGSAYNNISISNPNARATEMRFAIPNSNGRVIRSRWVTTRDTDTEWVGFEERIDYVYVDRDLTVSGRGRTWTNTWDGGSETMTTANFTFNFKEGWNTIYVRWDESERYNAANESWSYNSTQTLNLSNPSNVRWVIQEDDSDYYDKRRDDNDRQISTRRSNTFRSMRDNAK